MNELTPREKRIHAAQRELIDEAGGCEGAAAVLGLKKSQVGRMRVDPPEAQMSLYQLSKLEAFVGKPIVTQAMAAMLGFDMVSQAEPVATTVKCPHASIARVMGEATDLARVYAELAPDGLSPADASMLELELREAAQAIEHARQACAAITKRSNT